MSRARGDLVLHRRHLLGLAQRHTVGPLVLVVVRLALHLGDRLLDRRSGASSAARTRADAVSGGGAPC